MALLLGVDTGGTYTDAVLIRDEKEVIASAKSLTTRADLAIGVGGAIRAVLDQSGCAAADVSMAALSTTLATNALVEGQGGRVALIYIGFAPEDLDRHGLKDALKGDPALVLAGGHNHAGGEATPLDVEALRAFLETEAAGVSGFAVASLFATRNPAHEQEAARIIMRNDPGTGHLFAPALCQAEWPQAGCDCGAECAPHRDDRSADRSCAGHFGGAGHYRTHDGCSRRWRLDVRGTGPRASD